MDCIRPLKAGFDSDYNLTFSQKKLNKELASFEFPCRKCLPCRLNTAREKAIRCVHEAKMHENNIFLTLTYNDDNIGDNRLQYIDFQNFMKQLRTEIQNSTPNYNKDQHRIAFMVTGEYGGKTKRKHWHAIIFNYRPTDSKYKYTSDHGETVHTSETLNSLWGKGNTEFGTVTMDSAGYVARYGAKKLIHGKDQDHDYHPIHKTSSKHAIGKSFIQKYHKDIFTKGYVVLQNGDKAAIPRYYEDWYSQNYPDLYIRYLSDIKSVAADNARIRESEIRDDYHTQCNTATGGQPLTQKQVSLEILNQKFKQLQEREKQ